MTPSFMHSIWTVLVFAGIVLIAWWAYGPRRKRDWENAGRLPFDQGELEDNSQDTGEKHHA